MKNFKRFLLLGLAIIVSCSLARAQTNQTLNLRNSNGNLFRYGVQAILSTTDGSAHTIATLSIGSNEAGLIEATVIGFDSTNGDYVQGVVIVGYKKTGGTLTLATQDTIHAIAGSGGLSAGTFAFSASSNNVRLQVTGATAKNVDWIANFRWLYKKK